MKRERQDVPVAGARGQVMSADQRLGDVGGWSK